MKVEIVKSELITSEIDIDYKVTSSLSLYTNNCCEYKTCNNSHAAYIIDFGCDTEIEFLNAPDNMGVQNEVKIYEINNGD